MTPIDLLFIVGNFLLLIGTVLLIRAVLKNKDMLKGYDPIGALLTLVPLGLFIIAYVLMENWVSIVLGLPTVLYWALVSFYTIKERMIG